MFIELTEIDRSGEEIGKFMINTEDVSFVDTPKGGMKRIKMSNDYTFFIDDKDYEKMKKKLIA